MKGNKILGFTTWVLGLALGLIFLFFIPQERTETVWAIIICTAVVYLLHLMLWGLLQKGKLDFHNLPALTLSVIFLLVQTVWAIIVAFAATAIPIRTAILVNVVILIIQAFVIVLALISKNHIENMSSRQKDHHVEL